MAAALPTAQAMKLAATDQAKVNNKGLHLPSLFSATGALAGFSCQMGLREAFVVPGKAGEMDVFWVMGMADGSQMFAGPQIIALLLENPMSVWSGVSGALQRCGATALPDIREIANHATASMGKPEFGLIRNPNVQPWEKPIEAVRRLWPGTSMGLKALQVPPLEYGVVFGIVAQLLIVEYKDQLDPMVAATIIMEAATSMSKIDPKSVGV